MPKAAERDSTREKCPEQGRPETGSGQAGGGCQGTEMSWSEDSGGRCTAT